MKTIKKIAATLIVFIIASSLFSQTPPEPFPTDPTTDGSKQVGEYYSGGSGTSDAPYKIASIDDLQYLSEHSEHWDKYFIQTADIDASDTENWNDNGSGGYYGFSPIGNDNTNFTGSYDGQNHTINNLYINRPSDNSNIIPIGLFGVLETASIHRLGVINVNINGGGAGGLAGFLRDGTLVESCFSTGLVTSSASGGTGGLIGYGAGTGCGSASTVNNSYSTADVESEEDGVGGLFGQAGCIVNNCYATGSVTGTSSLGGFVGYLGENAEITNCYSTGSVSGSGSNINGFGGDECGGHEITNSFWDVETDGITGNSSGDDNFGATGKSTTEMQTKGTFTD